jgi:hypothetical protein
MVRAWREVTNGWWGQSPISAEGHDAHDWTELRSIAGEHVNEWNLLDDFEVAHVLAAFCSERNPIHGPYRAVLYATDIAPARLAAAL